MSSSLHVYGIKPPDEKWKKMKAVYDACKLAGLDPPDEVEKFFGFESPDEKGVAIRLEDNKVVCKKYTADMRNGFEVDLTALDPTIKIIRFVVSY